MITFIFVAIFGTILVGFMLYHFVFKNDGRKAGQSGPSAQAAEQPSKDRATGLD